MCLQRRAARFDFGDFLALSDGQVVSVSLVVRLRAAAGHVPSPLQWPLSWRLPRRMVWEAGISSRAAAGSVGAGFLNEVEILELHRMEGFVERAMLFEERRRYQEAGTDQALHGFLAVETRVAVGAGCAAPTAFARIRSVCTTIATALAATPVVPADETLSG